MRAPYACVVPRCRRSCRILTRAHQYRSGWRTPTDAYPQDLRDYAVERMLGQDRASARVVAKEILARRERTYAAARRKYVGRWTAKTRAWSHVKTAALNPERSPAPAAPGNETSAA